jgi:hypothetical protein
MKADWVDFKAVKAAVDIQMVLNHYGIGSLTKSRDELRGPCPIHKASARSKNFTVNIRKNAFKCFSNECGARGNVLDFVAAMESCTVRDAALKLKHWFKVGDSELESPKDDETTGSAKIPRGIYRHKDGELFEVLLNASSAEDFEPLVVYRELFGNYQFWVGRDQLFSGVDHNGDQVSSDFSLVKEL